MNSSNEHQTSRRRRIRMPTLLSAILASLTALACVLAAGAMAKPIEPKATNLQQDVDALVAAGAPGAILLVRDGNKTTRLVGGVADLATQRKISQGDHYRIASLTKTYVATVVLQLVGEGKLRLERHRRALAARRRPEREQDHDPDAAQPHERPLRP